MIRPAWKTFGPAAAIAAVMLGVLPVPVRAADEEKQSEAEAKAELADLIERWKERLHDKAESQKEYWAEQSEKEAKSRTEAKLEMAQLKERAKGLTATSTPAEVELALGKVGAELHSVQGKPEAPERTTIWNYLYHADEESYLSFEVRFNADKSCSVLTTEQTREQAAAEPKHVLEATFESFYLGYPSDERDGFSCTDASIDGMPVGRLPFVMSDHRPRISGRMDRGAKVRIVYHGRADDLVFLGQRALSLESMNFSGLPDITAEELAAHELKRKKEYERSQQQQPPPPPTTPAYTFPPLAQKTVDLLKKEIVPRVDYEDAEATVVFADISERLLKLGITHRFLIPIPKPPTPPAEPLPLGMSPPEKFSPEPRRVTSLHLENVSLFDFMHRFEDHTYWGWIVYPDGSIRYSPSQCACGYPTDGRAGHLSSYAYGLRHTENQE